MGTHRINRVEIELGVDEASLGEALSERVSLIRGRRIAPLIDRVCGDLSGSEAIDRLDRIEVDLGVVAAEDFEDDFLVRLEPALRAALAAALRRQAGREPPEQASLELLETFALTGNLPWWAEAREPRVVADHFARAAAGAPDDLIALVRRVSADAGALDRIARSCDDAPLGALAARARVRAEADAPSRRDTAARREVLSALAGRPRASQRPPAAAPPEAPRPAADRPRPDGPRRTKAVGDVEEPSRAENQRALEASPGTAGQPGYDAPERPQDDASVGGPLPDQDDAAQAGEASFAPPQRGPTPIPTRPAPASASDPDLDPDPRAPGSRTPDIGAARRAALGRLDEIYVDDAGLVILWPFLERFLLRTGLLRPDRRFPDDAAAVQGVALLAALATGDPAPPEHMVPLAKLLCGRPLESDFQLEAPVPPERLAEAELLLAAVIDRATVLGDLSIPGFRASFLRREAALSTRDGAWLLTVERQAHDALLDRFPWSWSWLKLPWMPEPLRVEW